MGMPVPELTDDEFYALYAVRNHMAQVNWSAWDSAQRKLKAHRDAIAHRQGYRQREKETTSGQTQSA